mmetsp:Transcript_125857/g.187839  ORF Transcript_125857/g.187839 Transcript_125857/m.187839 type:complete len:342 (-) Transcript_125857:80-1105(-)|eukprot:CAMPEP_0117016686 /NCGR_PEP_ID=MMETSP0472-20121206/13135_1 /TAXON_ID=693140 ORGANISM="Tiarina fusus, Strain LIS" /NCGR_SAMPLE_ID=MMETSP0472 /ASSEMBLY_ACC=CAM_ASM_000603 /LENGTH=341 /DNA_ID=CAMNT_0004720841 /DNA_START=68 /DNA_END=1093 /DNA_ORIENTATION=-
MNNSNKDNNREVPLATMHSAATGNSSSQNLSTIAVKSSQGGAVPLPTRMVLSAVAGMGAATFCHPLDVVRVQMQNFHYRGTAHAAVSIYQNAGLANGLYAGISAAYLRQWLYGSCRMGIYSYLLEQAKLRNNGNASDISFAQKLAMGSVSGGIGSFVGTPSEVALVRMSADSKLPLAERRNYTSVYNCLSRISQEEGVTKMWRGAAPTVVRATLLSSCSLAITSQSKSYLSESGWFGPNGQWLGGYPMMLCATLFSSFWANIVSNPFDVIKSRMQQMPISADGTALYNGMGDCFRKSVRAEGPMVLWAGFTPAFVKLAPYSIISLTLADKLTKAVTGKDAL